VEQDERCEAAVTMCEHRLEQTRSPERSKPGSPQVIERDQALRERVLDRLLHGRRAVRGHRVRRCRRSAKPKMLIPNNSASAPLLFGAPPKEQPPLSLDPLD
jgi:hypothetical protein